MSASGSGFGPSLPVVPVYFATTNHGKAREVEAMLGPFVVRVDLEVPEIQGTPAEVIKSKTLDAARVFVSMHRSMARGILIVDDMALSVDSLGGMPGPYIKDFLRAVGPDGLCRLAALSPATDIASYGVIEVDPIGGTVGSDACVSVVGRTSGHIVTSPKGTGGFGYDPCFMPDGYSATYACMTDDDKNQISARSKALSQLRELLQARTKLG